MKVKLGHSLENVIGSFSVGFWVQDHDEEVIHIDNKPSFSNHVLEQVIYELLECSRGITEVEEHDHWFEESFMGNEGHLPLVTVLDADIVVSPAKIKFCEVTSVF